jgi:hypothetical protein
MGSLVDLARAPRLDSSHTTQQTHPSAVVQQTSPTLPRVLEHRIQFIAKFYNFTPEELVETKEIAAGDIEAATVCFRHLLAKIVAAKDYLL